MIDHHNYCQGVTSRPHHPHIILISSTTALPSFLSFRRLSLSPLLLLFPPTPRCRIFNLKMTSIYAILPSLRALYFISSSCIFERRGLVATRRLFMNDDLTPSPHRRCIQVWRGCWCGVLPDYRCVCWLAGVLWPVTALHLVFIVLFVSVFFFFSTTIHCFSCQVTSLMIGL